MITLADEEKAYNEYRRVRNAFFKEIKEEIGADVIIDYDCDRTHIQIIHDNNLSEDSLKKLRKRGLYVNRIKICDNGSKKVYLFKVGERTVFNNHSDEDFE